MQKEEMATVVSMKADLDKNTFVKEEEKPVSKSMSDQCNADASPIRIPVINNNQNDINR